MTTMMPRHCTILPVQGIIDAIDCKERHHDLDIDHRLQKKSHHNLDIDKYSEGRYSLLWRHNGQYGVSNHQPDDCLLSRLFRRRSKKISKPRVTGLCPGNLAGTGEFPAQMASNAENVSIWWRHRVGRYVGSRTAL